MATCWVGIEDCALVLTYKNDALFQGAIMFKKLRIKCCVQAGL